MTVQIASVFPALPVDPAPIKVLAFDQSSHCGWALLWPGMKRPLWGVLELKVGADGDETPALKPLRRHIEWAVLEEGATHVFFEQPMMPNRNNPPTIHGQRQWMMVAVIQDNTDRLLDRSAEAVPISSWRKLFLGMGKLNQSHLAPGDKLSNHNHRTKTWKKTAMSECATRGWYVDSDNAADALGIGVYGLSCVSQTFLVQQGPLFRRAEMRGEVRP